MNHGNSKDHEEAPHHPLICIQSSTFAQRYVSGVYWQLFGWRTHGETLRADIGFFLGMLHGGVLTPASTPRPDATTLAIIYTSDFREGYERGRRDYFTRYEEIIHTEDELLDLFKARAQDNLYLGREQDTLRWAVQLENFPGGCSRSPSRNSRTCTLRRRSSL